MKYEPSSIWTFTRQNKEQTECIDPYCEVTEYCGGKYGDKKHYHDAGGPSSFEEWYKVEGADLLEGLLEKLEDGDFTPFTKLVEKAAQLGWEAAIKADLS